MQDARFDFTSDGLQPLVIFVRIGHSEEGMLVP